MRIVPIGPWAILILLGAWLPSGVVSAQSWCVGFEECLNDLAQEDSARKSAAIFVLGTLKDRRATPSLLEVLKNDSRPEIRQSTVKALGFLNDPVAVPALAESIYDPSLRHDAVRALVKVGNKPAVEALLKGLKDNEVQIAAAQGLGEIADPSAKPALVSLLRKTKDERLHGVVAIAIQRINAIWGPSEEEMGIPQYPKSEFIPNAKGEWVFHSEDSIGKVSDFFQKRLRKEPLNFQVFKQRYETGFDESKEGVPRNNPSLIFVAREQKFGGKVYPAQMIFLQETRKQTEIKIFTALGGKE